MLPFLNDAKIMALFKMKSKFLLAFYYFIKKPLVIAVLLSLFCVRLSFYLRIRKNALSFLVFFLPSFLANQK